MYAVVSTGGKQYRVAKDDVIVVEKLNAEVGDTVTFDVLLVADGDDVTVGADAAAAVVTGEIVDHVRGEKLTVFKFKKRKGYKKTLGHRQDLTKVRVADVSLSGSKPKAAKKAAPKAEGRRRGRGRRGRGSRLPSRPPRRSRSAPAPPSRRPSVAASTEDVVEAKEAEAVAEEPRQAEADPGQEDRDRRERGVGAIAPLRRARELTHGS